MAGTLVTTPLLPSHCVDDFASVFEKESFDRFPERCRWDHAFELKPGSDTFNTNIYPFNPTEQAELDKFRSPAKPALRSLFIR